MTEKQKRFVDEYLIDLNATAAARRAGYKDPNKGRQLVTKSNVSKYIQEQLENRSQRTNITQDKILTDLIEIKERCMADDHFDAKNAIKTLELLGKHLGMFTEKLKTETTGAIEISWQQ